MKNLIFHIAIIFLCCNNPVDKKLDNNKQASLKSTGVLDTFIIDGNLLSFEPILLEEKVYSFQDDSLENYIERKIRLDSKKLPKSVDSLLSVQLDRFVYDSYYFGKLRNFSILFCEYESGSSLLIINKKKKQISSSSFLVSVEGEEMDNYFLNLVKTTNGYKQIFIHGLNNEEDDDILKIVKVRYNDLVLGQESFELTNFTEKRVKKVVSITKPFIN